MNLSLMLEPFFNSSLTDTSNWIDSLKERGYLFFPNFLNRMEVVSVRKQILEKLKKEDWITSTDEDYKIQEPVRWINSPEFYRCIDSFMQIEDLHLLGKHSSLIKLMEHLLGETVFAHPRKMIRTSYPIHMNKKDLIPPHQDVFYVRGELDTFTVWIPLGDYPLSKGGLRVAEGSHKQTLLPTAPTSEGRFGCKLADINEENFLWKQSSVKMGDILVFHSLTLHAASPNIEDQIRLSVDCRFSAATGVINEEQFLPPYHPHVREWKELSKGWKQPNFFQIPSTLTIQPASHPLSEAIQRPSKYVK